MWIVREKCMSVILTLYLTLKFKTGFFSCRLRVTRSQMRKNSHFRQISFNFIIFFPRFFTYEK